MFPEYLGTYDADFDGFPRPVTVQPRMLVRDRSEIGSRGVAPLAPQPPIDQFSGENLEAHAQLATATTRGKQKSTAPSSDIYTSANSIIGLSSEIIMTEPTKPMREMIVNDWVKKQKLTKTKIANLKGRGRKRKSLVVVLKLSREGWTRWEEQKIEPDLIMKELVLRDGRVHKILVDKRGSGDVSARGRCASATASTSEYASGSATGGAESKKRGRGRPMKNPSLAPPDLNQDEGEDNDEDEDEDELEVIPQPKERKEGALRARKREAEEKEEAANAIENEKRARERAIEAEENARLKAIEDKEKARLKAIEDEKRRIEEEKQNIENERQRMAYEKKAAQEEKRKRDEERLRAIENEKKRKEAERRRAYQEAKMMATRMAEGNLDEAWGYDSEEEYVQQKYQEEDQEMMEGGQIWGEKEKCWWELELPGSSFAVAIGRRPGYHWKTQYITDTESAPRTSESNKSTISTPTSATKTAKIKEPLANTRNTRKSTASTAAVVGDITPATQPRQKHTLKPTMMTTKPTISRGRTAGGDILDPDDEFITPGKWPLNKRQAPGAQAAGGSGPLESARDGFRERRVTTKYSAVESFELGENAADWSAGIGIGGDAEAEAMSISGGDDDMEEGYDDRWKRGGRRRVW